MRVNACLIVRHREPVPRRIDPEGLDVASSFTAKFSFGCSRMDLVCPKKLVAGDGVDCHRNNKKRRFDRGNFRRPIAEQQEKHPGQKHHCVAVGELPAAGIAVCPKGECKQTDRCPSRRFVVPALAKDQKQKWAGEENRTPERIKIDKRKIGRVSKAFEQHFVDVPGNGVKREKSAMVARLLENFTDKAAAKVKDRVKGRVIVERREKTGG